MKYNTVGIIIYILEGFGKMKGVCTEVKTYGVKLMGVSEEMRKKEAGRKGVKYEA
jgi:hypothetical protein